MKRQAIVLTALVPTVGLGLFLLSKRELAGPYIRERMEEAPEVWHDMLERQIADTSEKIAETREALEEAARATEMRTAGALDSALAAAKRATISAAIGAFSLSLLGALVIFIYAPERYQQERLWRSSQSVLLPIRNALAGLWRLGTQRPESPTENARRGT